MTTMLHAISSSEQIDPTASVVAVFLHGFGSNERDLAGLAYALPAGLPWVSLQAPIAVGTGAYAWFPIGEPGNPDPAQVAAAVDAIWAWADAALPAGARIAPIGFSQGGLMASQLLRTAPERVIAPVILGGFVQAGEQPGDAVLRETRPAVFSGRGEADRVIAEPAVTRTDAWLPEHTTATARSYSGLAHGIDARELEDMRAFLTAQLTPVSAETQP
ncbi:phospholipase/carboxylesterase [Microbacterium sp. W4I4]|uniref:alpha/beta hydrolase n=1 Tax=Microbacterium sp. W4I4 TaxID=3042295 RepID=UPI00277F4465|nr:alpha/beta fold hydrolase [Microbacterium sp. W4I4]MDQ0614710.1 phospholipase/carboxylesterase [Microbacterium sp. W4I4]